MKKLQIILMMLFLLSACKGQSNSWTKESEQALYNHLDSVSKPTMPDDAKRAKYLSFYVKRVTEEIPNGIRSVSRDSLHNLDMRIGREYAMKESKNGSLTGMLPSYTRWTPTIEKAYKDGFIAVAKSKGEKVSDEFCNCVVNELKKIYPDSLLLPVPNKIMISVATDCRKYNRLK